VQKQLPEYGKYEKGNKLSYEDLNNYIEKYHKKKKISFFEHIYPKMKVNVMISRKLQQIP
jgi:hypothetical protein